MSRIGLENINTLNAAKLNGFSYDQYEGCFKTVIDTRALDINTWYPVVIRLGDRGSTSAQRRHIKNFHIQIIGFTSPQPEMKEMAGGVSFGFNYDWTVDGEGWTSVYDPILQRGSRIIKRAFCSKNYENLRPIAGIGQITESSEEFFYIRGGFMITVMVNHDAEVFLCTEKYNSQDPNSSSYIQPTTVMPAEIVRNMVVTQDLKNYVTKEELESINQNNNDMLEIRKEVVAK